MDAQSIEKEIQAKGLNAPRITKEQIDTLMDRVFFFVIIPQGTTSTFAHAYLDGKFFLATGHSACVSPENFNVEIGEKIAIDKVKAAAWHKLWELEGYRLYQQLKEAA